MLSSVPVHRRPFAGAWIETPILSLPHDRDKCRPFAGAWIETQRGGMR